MAEAWPEAIESRSPCGCATATGAVVCMQPDSASAVMMAMIGNRNARATRTGAIPHSETVPVLHRLWLTNGFLRGVRRADAGNRTGLPHHAKRSGVDACADRTRHPGAA